MKDLSTIIRECYNQLPSLPGNYRILDELLSEVNKTLSAELMEQIDENALCECAHKHFPTKIEREYKRDENVFSAIRIILPAPCPTLSETEKRELRSHISTILFSNCYNTEGWYELVKIGPILLNAGFDYKELGFSKLTDLLKSVFDEDYKSEERGDTMHPNQKYVYLNTVKYASEDALPFESRVLEVNVNKSSTRPVTPKWKKQSAFDKLMNFAIFPNKGEENGFNFAIRQLAEDKALKKIGIMENQKTIIGHIQF